MRVRKVTLVSLIALAVILQIIARRYYGSQMHRALLTVLTYAALGDATWLISTMIRDGETPLRTDSIFHPLTRAVAVILLVIGLWVGLRQSGLSN
jgi:hypothetical protein